MEGAISLHGLGFVQVQLAGNRRLHVWHPDLPRRACFESSAIHDHRFSFTSQVLIGTQINHTYKASQLISAHAEEYVAYLHEGPRTEFGNRPWIPDSIVTLTRTKTEVVDAGSDYEMSAYVFHSTEPGGDGRVATLLTKTWEGNKGARSLCVRGVTPDADFNRHQLSDRELWRFVMDVLASVNE
jgi:hypothetical protein